MLSKVGANASQPGRGGNGEMELLVPHAATHITLLQGAGQPLEGTDSERPLPSPEVCCDSTARHAPALLAIRRTLLRKNYHLLSFKVQDQVSFKLL